MAEVGTKATNAIWDKIKYELPGSLRDMVQNTTGVEALKFIGNKAKNTFTPNWIKGMCSTVTDAVFEGLKDEKTPDFKWSEEDFYDLPDASESIEACKKIDFGN